MEEVLTSQQITQTLEILFSLSCVDAYSIYNTYVSWCLLHHFPRPQCVKNEKFQFNYIYTTTKTTRHPSALFSHSTVMEHKHW
jgi:hypothetical protein